MLFLTFGRRRFLREIFLHLACNTAKEVCVYPFLRPQTLPNVNIIHTALRWKKSFGGRAEAV